MTPWPAWIALPVAYTMVLARLNEGVGIAYERFSAQLGTSKPRHRDKSGRSDSQVLEANEQTLVDATILLLAGLTSGDISAEGVRGDTGEVSAIRPSDWARLKPVSDFIRDEKIYLPAADPNNSIVVHSIRLKSSDVAKMKVEKAQQVTRAAKKRGRKPLKGPAIKEEIRKIGAEKVRGWTQEAMAAQFGASRETCQKALDEVMSEIALNTHNDN